MLSVVWIASRTSVISRMVVWFVGWFYGIALLVTVASVDTGVVSYVAALTHNWFHWNLDPSSHGTILVVTLWLWRAGYLNNDGQ